MRRSAQPLAQEEEDNEINLTPMLDVVFIMLIFFIVTASFVKEAGLDVNRPDVPEVEQPEENKSILINLTALNEIQVAGRNIDPRAVRANIERLHAEEPDAPIVVRPHVKSKTELLVVVLDAVRQAGLEGQTNLAEPFGAE